MSVDYPGGRMRPVRAVRTVTMRSGELKKDTECGTAETAHAEELAERLRRLEKYRRRAERMQPLF